LLPSSVAAQTVIGELDTVTVPGSQSSPWNIPDVSSDSSDLQIYGALVIRDGGVVNSPSTSVESVDKRDSVATVTVSGPGSVWNTGDLNIATDQRVTWGNATLAIDSGATVNSGVVRVALSGSALGPYPEVFASATLRGTGTEWNARSLWLGVGGVPGAKASLVVSQGGILNTAELSQVGHYYATRFSGAFSDSSLAITDADSRWNAHGGVAIERGSQVTVASGGTLSAPFVRLTPGSTGIPFPQSTIGGVLNVGGAVGADLKPLAATLPGNLDVPVIEFASRTGTLNFNHTSTDYVFNGRLVETDIGQLSSFGQVGVYSGTTRLTADSSAFGGTTTIAGGRLLVDGKLGGRILVNNGVLGGNGEVGSIEVGAGGTLAPGSSIGQMSVNGDLTFNPGSVFQVEVTPEGASDQVGVSGKVVINGGSMVSLGNRPEFLPFTQYTILTAGGGVSGTFAEATNNYAFLRAALSYEPTTVKLQLIRNDISFSSIGITPNQQAVAAGAESTGPGHPLWNAVAVMDPASARAAFDLISGEIHAGTQAALIEDGLVIQQTVLGAFDAHKERKGAWAKVFGSRAETDADGNAGKLERDSAGLLIGGDIALGDAWHLGGLIGSGRTRNDIDERNSNSESDSVSAGIYADAQWEAGWRLRLGGIRTRHDIDSRRQLDVSGIGNQFTASTEARTTQFFGELGYPFGAGAFAFEPFLGLSQVRLDVDAFAESGGVGALQSNDSESVTRYAMLGLRLTRESAGAGRWHIGSSLAWRHASGDLEPVSVLRFDGGQAFAIQGVPMSQDHAVVEANVATKLTDRVYLGASYLGQIASNAEDHGAALWLNARF